MGSSPEAVNTAVRPAPSRPTRFESSDSLGVPRPAAHSADHDGAVLVRGVRCSDDAIRTCKQLLPAVHPARALGEPSPRAPGSRPRPCRLRTRPRQNCPSRNGTAEIDHAGRFLPPERMRERAAVPRVTDHHPPIAARVIRATQRGVTGCGTRAERPEQLPLRRAQPDGGFQDAARVGRQSDDRAAVAAHLRGAEPPMEMTPVVGIQ